MQTISMTKVIELRWKIRGYEEYYFGNDKNLYNIKTGRKLLKTINNRSVGYWLGKKFYSQNKLKQLLIRPDNYYCPF